MNIKRRKSKTIRVGNLIIGGGYPVSIQSMIKIKTESTGQVIGEINKLDQAGCQIVRLAVKDMSDALAIKKIKPKVRLPIVADIHFDYRLALKAIDSGADKIRLNPGNINKLDQIKEVVAAMKACHIPLRVGLNSGSVKDQGSSKLAMPDKLVKSALSYIKILENLRFNDIVISLKASNVLDTVTAYKKISRLCDYPMHLGVTATGSPFSGAIKTSIAIGALLLEGIGDTIRVSLTDTSVCEVLAAKAILESLELRKFGHSIISCPTCGRCEVDLVKLVKNFENKVSLIPTDHPKSIALMGCVVNGPGEAKEADIGIAFGKKDGLLFKNGKAARKVSYTDCLGVLLKELDK